LFDHAVLVDHIRDASRVFVLRRFGGTVGESDGALRVAEQREGKIKFLGEAAILRGRVETGAEDLRVLRLELDLEVPEPGTLTRSTRCVGLRIKPEDDFLPAQLGEPDAIAEMIGDVEIGGRSAGAQHGRFSSEECTNDPSHGHHGLL
jgi:hypothetical protein